MTILDPTEEMKAIRHRLGAEFDYDLDKIVADIQLGQANSGLKYVTLSPRKIIDNPFQHPNNEDSSIGRGKDCRIETNANCRQISTER